MKYISIVVSLAFAVYSGITNNLLAMAGWICCLLAEIELGLQRRLAKEAYRLTNNVLDHYQAKMNSHLKILQVEIDEILDKETDESLRNWYNNRESAIDLDEKYQVG